MAFEYPTSAGMVRLIKIGKTWKVRYAGQRKGQWHSPDAAIRAVARHKTGLKDWDSQHEPISSDIIDWRPLGDSI